MENGLTAFERRSRALVGIETPLSRIEDEVAVFALERGPRRTRLMIRRRSRRAPTTSTAMKRHAQTSNSLDETIIGNLDVEQISDLEVLFYTGRESEFGELHEVGYRHVLEKNRLEKPPAYVHHLMSKTNLLDAVVTGCRIVGRPSLGETLQALRHS